MKFFLTFVLALIPYTFLFAATPSFYLVDIRRNNDAILHATNPEIQAKKQLKLIFLESTNPTCCFNFGLQKPNIMSSVKIDNDSPLLISDKGEETFQIGGFFKGIRKLQPEAGLAFGFENMSDVKAKGNRTFKILFSDNKNNIYVRHCLGAEGVNFYLFHSLSDKKPFANYYYSLGYDVKANCPIYE